MSGISAEIVFVRVNVDDFRLFLPVVCRCVHRRAGRTAHRGLIVERLFVHVS